MFRMMVAAALVSIGSLSSAQAAEPAARSQPYSGWGSGLMTVSLVDTIKKAGPVAPAEPRADLDAFAVSLAQVLIAQAGR